ncbi:autotransporter outer membrane beta-barrel domain-containing protein, partial [Escherichia coli]
MNRIYRLVWNATQQAWVVAGEFCRTHKKTKILFFERYTTRLLRALSGIFSPVVRTSVTTIALVMASTHGAWAVTCPADVNGSYRTGWINATYGVGCNEVPATTGSPTVLNSNASWYVLAGSNLTVGADVITIGATNISYLGTNSFSLIGNQYLTHGSINFTDVTATLTNSGSGGGINGLSTHNTVPINGNNFTLTTNSSYVGSNSSGGVGSYAILAGSSVDSGEAIVANNGKFSTITLNNATIRQSTSGGFIIPVLNAGLRAIQGASGNSGNGSSGKIEIKGTLDMILTGARIEGIYVSGAASDSEGAEAISQVVLNNTTLKMVKSGTQSYDSSAIKIGKSRTVGSGKGLIVSNGALNIDMDPNFGGRSAYMSSAIKMAVSGSELQANEPNSSTYINASRSVLAIGIDDWGTSVDSTGIKASFGNATIKTQSITAPLLLVDSGQQDVGVLFDRHSNLTAASDGYLVDIIKYRNSTTASSLKLTLDNGSTMTGLTNKAYANSTLNIDLNNGSTWNLAEKATGTVATSAFDTLAMNGGSTLNGTTQSTSPAKFILKGNVTSTGSTLNLTDGKVGDVLTIQGSYVGNNGNLFLDTVLGDDSSPTDKLVVSGSATGTTYVKVTNEGGTGARTLNGIELITTGSSTDDAFVQSGRIAAGAYDYSLVRGTGSNSSNWYLSNTTPTPTTPTTPT